MSSSDFDLSVFEDEPVLAIIRGVTRETFEGVFEAVIGAGLKFAEITLNTPNALNLLEESSHRYSTSVCLGAGTVLSVKDAEQAAGAGARFIVSPTLDEDVAAFCRERNLVYFPGALTPTEIEKAWNSGACMVKVFPASQVGPQYFKLIRGPFPDIRLMAVGGVNPGNISDYLKAGASAVALGGSVISPERMNNREFSLIQKEAEEFLFAVKNFFSKIKI